MNKANWNILWKDRVATLGAQHEQVLKILDILLKNDSTISSLCDFGCGQGMLLKEIKTLYPTLKIKGADNTEFSKSRLKDLNIEYLNFDLTKDSLNGKIDIGIMSDVLEHFYNPLQVLQNLSNLKYLIIVVPNFSFIKERFDVLKGQVPFEMKPKRGGHFFWFNEESLNDLIMKSDFETIKTFNLYPKKLNYLPFLKPFNNLFATSFCILLKNKNIKQFMENK